MNTKNRLLVLGCLLILALSGCKDTSSDIPENQERAKDLVHTSAELASPTPKATIPLATTATTKASDPTTAPTDPALPATLADTSTPMPAETEAPVFATPSVTMTGSILVAFGDHDRLALAQIDEQGGVWPLSEPQPMSFVQPLHLSPDGTWLAYYDTGYSIRLYNLWTHESQMVVKLVASASVPIFDESSRYIAFATATALQPGGTYEWAIHVRDIETGIETVFHGPVVGPGEQWDEPLPGEPIAWVGDELFLDGYVPYAETIWWGIRVLDLSGVAPGEQVSLERYDRLLIAPGDVNYWLPTLSPTRDRIAFLIAAYDYEPACYDNPLGEDVPFGLGVVATAGGAPRILVDATREQGVLPDEPLTWSPDGNEILFAIGACPDALSLFEPELRTVNLDGDVTSHWPPVHIDDTINEALWCTPETIFFLRTQNELWRLDVETGQMELVLDKERIRLIDCYP